MKSFKLKNKEEEQKNKEKEQEVLEQQKKETEINAQNENLNFIQKNPQTVVAIFLGLLTIALMFLNISFFWVIPIMFGVRQLMKAKKIGENKKFITIGYIIVVYLPIFFWILSSILFAINAINNAK